MHMQASLFQLFAIGLLVASTVAVAQKVFELYGQAQAQKSADGEQNSKDKLN